MDYLAAAGLNLLLEEYDWAWERQRQEDQGGVSIRKVGVMRDNLKSCMNLSVTCLRELNESTDSISFSSDDEEVAISPSGVIACQSAGPGESQAGGLHSVAFCHIKQRGYG